jgi:hypothetical protein
MIEEMLKAGVPEEEIVQRVMDAFGIGEVEARFMVGIVTGEISGDVIEVDDDGNEVRPA